MKTIEHDCGLITAYNPKYTNHENTQRTRQLEAKIQIRKYGVCKIENKDFVQFLVVDTKDNGQLRFDLIKWSKDYEQDKIEFIRKGDIVTEEVLSYINSNDISNYYEIANIMGKWSMTLIANKDWRDVNV